MLYQVYRIYTETMPIPYSNGIRSRAIKLLTKDKKTQKQVADIFSITQATISRWLKDSNTNGHCNLKGNNRNQDNRTEVSLDKILV